jgi:hypothetical protein
MISVIDLTKLKTSEEVLRESEGHSMAGHATLLLQATRSLSSKPPRASCYST